MMIKEYKNTFDSTETYKYGINKNLVSEKRRQ